MDSPLPLPPPPFVFADAHHLDERAERPLEVVFQLVERLRMALTRSPPPAEPVRRDTLPELLERVRAAPPTPVGIANPLMPALTDGYQYRAVPVKLWAASAHVPEDIATAAAVAASEALAPARYPAYGWAILEAVQNAARMAQRTITEQATRDVTHLQAHLHFGRQSGRWCSTFAMPTAQHIELAKLALHPREHTLIAGTASRWIDPMCQDGGKQAGKALAYNAVGIVQKWGADGWEWIGPSAGLDGELLIDPYRLMLFRRAVTKAPAGVMLARLAILDGRRRWKVTPAIADPTT